MLVVSQWRYTMSSDWVPINRLFTEGPPLTPTQQAFVQAVLGPEITVRLLNGLLRNLPGKTIAKPNWRSACNELCIFIGLTQEDGFRHGDSRDVTVPPRISRVLDILWEAAETAAK